jgi:hypothetical protein
MAREQVQTGRQGARRGSKTTTTRPAVAGQERGTAPKSVAAEQRGGTPMVQWKTVAVPVPVPVGMRVPTPHLHMPHVAVPSPARVAARRTAFAVRTVAASLPAPRQLAYYGALGVAAAVGVLDWPVAAAVGAGMWVASHTGRRHDQPGQAHDPRQKESAAAVRPR